jgi:hypothetical protein
MIVFILTIIIRDPEPFDWYQRYSGVRDLVNQVIIHRHTDLCVFLKSKICNLVREKRRCNFNGGMRKLTVD